MTPEAERKYILKFTEQDLTEAVDEAKAEIIKTMPKVYAELRKIAVEEEREAAAIRVEVHCRDNLSYTPKSIADAVRAIGD